MSIIPVLKLSAGFAFAAVGMQEMSEGLASSMYSPLLIEILQEL